MTLSRVNKLIQHLRVEGTSSQEGNHGLFPLQTSAVQQNRAFGPVGTRSGDDVVIVSAVRTPIGKAKRGSFKNTTPDDLLKAVLEGVGKKSGENVSEINDVVVGNCQMGGSYAGPARGAEFRAGYPINVTSHTLNRQCSSGLQAVANIAAGIKAGYIDAGVGAGVESMTFGGQVSTSGGAPTNESEISGNKLAADALIPMGITSENVASRYGITREEQDKMAAESHAKALLAQKNGWFDDEIIPVQATIIDKDGNTKEMLVTKDDGPRPGSTPEKLAKLKPAFKEGGSTTAGNASQVSDGAAAVLLMKRDKAERLGIPILGTFRGFKVVGVEPDEMGVGPAVAIPAVLEDTHISAEQVDAYEINEAFASQAMYCVKKLGIPMEKVNPVGGAIALGHPLGSTGARQVATLLNYLRRTNGKIGVVSMCIGTGMGAAAVIEAEK